MVRLLLFGAPRIEQDGVAVPLRRTRALALLAYLALTRQPQERDQLVALLWPEFDTASARNNLRRELSLLKSTLGESLLDADRLQVSWGTRADCQVDVVEFTAALAAVRAHAHAPGELCATCATMLAEAVERYADDLLAGFDLSDSPAFEDWLFFQREGLRQQLDAALVELAAYHGARGALMPAIGYGRRRLALDPLHEPARRELMRLYAQAGQHAAALRLYEEGLRLWADELGAEPESETVALAEAIRSREFPAQLRPAPTLAPGRRVALPTAPLVGREVILAELVERLRDPACRLLTLSGPAGIGKTRLAEAVAHAMAGELAHGAAFVPLGALGVAQQVAPAILAALDEPLIGSGEPLRQLVAHLRERQFLLVLDTLEHLPTSGAILNELLSAAPGLRILTTSREPLGLAIEWVYPVPGLACPASAADLAACGVEAFGATALFVAQARRSLASFEPHQEDLPALVRICQLLDGMPLGLELAAPWVQSMRCTEIADEIERNLDFLSTTLPHMPERHRSLRAVYEQTWARLSVDEQQVLQRLAVFEGGATREAAEQVAGATLPLLQSLVVKALLRRDQAGRYGMHALVRQFALARLEANSVAYQALRRRHSRYFGSFLASRTDGVRGERSLAAMAEIAAALANVRAAWLWAAASGDVAMLEQAAPCLWEYYDLSCAYAEGEGLFREAAAAVPESPLKGWLLAAQGHLHGRQGRSEEGIDTIRRGLALLRSATPRDPQREALPLVALGFLYLQHGQYAKAQACGQEALPTWLASGDAWGIASCLLLLGTAALEVGQIGAARYFFDECHSACRRGEIRIERFYTNYFLLRIAIAQGDYVKAVQCLADTRSIHPAVDTPRARASVFRQRGLLAVALGELDEAVSCLRESVRIWLDHGIEPHMLLRQLANALRLRGELDEAEELLLRGLARARAVGNLSEVGDSLHELGRLAGDRDDRARAEAFFREALALWQEEGHASKAALVMGDLAATLVQLGRARDPEVRALFRDALSPLAEQGLLPALLHIAVGVAWLKLDQADQIGAGQLLALTARHPAATYATKQRASLALALLPAAPPAPPGPVDAHALAELLRAALSGEAPPLPRAGGLRRGVVV